MRKVPFQKLAFHTERAEEFFNGSVNESVCNAPALFVVVVVGFYLAFALVKFGFYKLCKIENKIALSALIVRFDVPNNMNIALVDFVMVFRQVAFHIRRLYVLV